MTDLDEKYMSRADLYREACTPRSTISVHFVSSLRFRIIQDDPERWDEELAKQVCQPWCVALRSAIREAWDDYRSAEYTVAPERLGTNEDIRSYAYGQRYTAMKVIRTIAREMYRETVPQDERIM